MRYFIFDKFNTWYDWRLTLTAKNVTPPEPKTNYVALDGMSGSLDLSEALTGEVAYHDRTVTASFWTSEGTFMDRIRQLGEIDRALHGKKVQIIDPDDPEHYFLGRVQVKSQSYDQVHAEFKLEAICDPWRYAVQETERHVYMGRETSETSVVIRNNGIKTLCPIITIAAETEGDVVVLSYDGSEVVLTDGMYRITDIKLRSGVNVIGVAGTGSVTFTYREAGL